MAAKEILHNGVRYDFEEFKAKGTKADPIDKEKVLIVDVRNNTGIEGSAAVQLNEEATTQKPNRRGK